MQALAQVSTLAHNVVHIWVITLDCYSEQQKLYETFLSVDEKNRAYRLSSSVLKERFIACHGKLREILATYTATLAPERLIFNMNSFGKPFLCNFDDIQFNLTYSEDIAMLAIARNRVVGIDLEKRRDIEMNAIAARFFSESEIAELDAEGEKMRKHVFFRTWVRKEAYTKALGRGFNLVGTEFSVLANSHHQDALIQGLQTSDDKIWRIADIKCPEGFHAAVCSAGKDWECLYINDY